MIKKEVRENSKPIGTIPLQSIRKPVVSVVFITHNRCDLLAEAIESVLYQETDVPYEIIVVDNASTDSTVVMLRERFPYVTCLKSAENLGVAGGRNLGIEHAKGESIIFIDDDAEVNGKLLISKVTQIFNESPNTAVIAFRIENEGHNNRVLSHEYPKRGVNVGISHQETHVSYFIGCGFAVRREIFVRFGGFFKEMFYGPEEVEFSYRVLDQGYNILYCPSIIIRHKTDPAIRRKKMFYYHGIRSRILMVMRNLPWWLAIPFLIHWHVRLLTKATLSNSISWYLRGVQDGWRDSRLAFQLRKPISSSTARRIWKLSGRLFY